MNLARLLLYTRQQLQKKGIETMKELEVKVKNVYGNTYYYPTCRDGETLAELAGTKTLTPAIMKLANRLGYTFAQAVEKIEL